MFDEQKSVHALKFNKDDILKKLKDNRGKHRDVFLAAQKDYREEVIAWLDEQLAAARDGKNFSTYFDESAPTDHTKDYNAAIAMLEMCIDTKIILKEKSFRRYILDEWDWRQDFYTNTYTSKHL